MVAVYLCSWFSAGCLLDRGSPSIKKVTKAGGTLVIPARMEDKTASPERKKMKVRIVSPDHTTQDDL